MQRTPIILVVLTVAACGRETPVSEQPSPEDAPGIGLRTMALSTSASDLGFAADDEFPTVYGVLTDWDIGGTVATVMVLRDGTASLYTTSTFGILGGGEHESVRQAAVRNVRAAESFADSATAVSEFDYPEGDRVYFYVLTYNGVRRVVGDVDAIEQGTDPTGPLFAAAQDVLTELRLVTERDHPDE